MRQNYMEQISIKLMSLEKQVLVCLYCVGDNKAADSIEDTAVELSDYLLTLLIFGYDGRTWAKCYLLCTRRCRQIHLRPVLNLKTTEGHQFKNIATEVAILVKKYRVP
jgi:hypothetical protein